jgi:aldehyde dehydrogenase (NAD+)
MKTRESTTPVRAFDRAYINGQFVTPHGTQIVDLVNPTDNKVIGKVTMADEIDAREAIGAAKEAFSSFSESSKEYRMELLQRLHDAAAKRMDQLVEATVVEYGAPGHIYAMEFERRLDRDQGGAGNRCRMHGRHQARSAVPYLQRR